MQWACVCIQQVAHTHSSSATVHAEVDTTPDLPLGCRNVKLDGSNCPLQVMDVPTYTHGDTKGGVLRRHSREYLVTLPVFPLPQLYSAILYTATWSTSILHRQYYI